MTNVVSLFRRVPKAAALAAGSLVAAVVPAGILFAWGPDRPTYTTASPAPHVTFNSITDNPAQGDERNFVRVKPAEAPNSAYNDSVSLEAGKEYTVFVYYQNDAACNLNASGKGIAIDAYVKAAVPAVVKGDAKVVGYVGASNATPKEVWDEATFTSQNAIALRMVPGSAKIYSKGAVNGTTLPDSIVTTGSKLGYDALDGKVPGCDKYAGYVTFKVKADQPNFTVDKKVRLSGTKQWQESVTAKPGDKVDFQIEYKNTGTTWQNNVVVRDTLPGGLAYVKGSTMFANASQPQGKAATDELTIKGLNIGNYAAGANGFVKFSATVVSEDKLQCGANTLTNIGRVETNNGSKQDTAVVTVTKKCQVTPVETPQPSQPTEPTPPAQPEQPKQEQPAIPAEIPSTGPAAIFGGLIGSSALGLGVHSYLNSRRALRDALKR